MVDDFVILTGRNTITGLSVSPDGSFVLSAAMDGSVRCWDVRPFVAGDSRCVKAFGGASVSN